MFRSILPGRALQRADYDLPLYRTFQEPEAFPPAPISKSVYMPTSPNDKTSPQAAPRPRSDNLVVLARRDRHYQQKLQDLLDAQSDGLQAGLDGTQATEDDEESLNTPTQTTYSLRSGSVSPSPRDRRKKKTLAQARRGIWKTVLDCAALKEEEDYILKQELRENQAVLQQLEAWSLKENGLKDKISAIENEDRGARAEELKTEASKLEHEIQDMEIRLAQMKTRHRQILTEISDVENSVSSKLSSYKSSLAILEKDVNQFLKNPPLSSERSQDASPFLSLPPKRRTLELAKEHWQSDIEGLKRQRRSARRDRDALENGADVWRDVVAEITEYEQYLRDAVTKPSIRQNSPSKGKGKSPASPASGLPPDMLERIDSVLQSVEEKLDVAHEKQWRLLEVCIEAELHALQQAREVLLKVLGISTNGNDTPRSSVRADEESENEGPSTQDSSARDLFASAAEGLPKDKSPMSHSAAFRKSMYEDDDGPDSELLFTRPADDTE